MPAPLSQDLRERIVRAVEGGSSIRQAASRFDVSPSAAVKLMERHGPRRWITSVLKRQMTVSARALSSSRRHCRPTAQTPP